ncbi:MAG TPA: hypothetical protein C5S51_06705 [Methanosarcinaceae archaeon]|nr:hypothetical protein [Methanosarcinaceae archaeon]
MAGDVIAVDPVDPDPEFDPMVYDIDDSGAIDKPEVFNAIADYFDKIISKEQVFDVIAEYFK